MSPMTVSLMALYSATAPPQRSVMVLEITGDPKKEAEQASAMVALAARAQPNLRVVMKHELDKALDEAAAGQLSECQQDPGCIARITEPLNVDLLISGSIAKT